MLIYLELLHRDNCEKITVLSATILLVLFSFNAFSKSCEVKGRKENPSGNVTTSSTIQANNEFEAAAIFKRQNPGFDVISVECK